ncbi:hypothetical protein CGCVW01_v008340 [Colletotrichum viniferum]|nr:hypothetical protein CGCVW01_v008340 [Colletotrichum viniferum]
MAEMKSLTAGAAESGAVARGPNLPQAVPTPAKTYLVTLPRELILEIIKLCVPPRPLRNTITMNRTITVSQLSLVDKSLREMCIPTLFRTLKLRTGQHELLGHIQVLEDSRVLEVVQHLRINSIAWDDVTPQWKRGTPARLAKLLGRMPNLQDLDLTLRWGMKSLATAVQDELMKQRIAIPTAKRFKYDISDSKPDPSILVSFIPSVFAELRALHLHLKPIASLKSVPGLSTIAPRLELRTLSLHNRFWTFRNIEEIYELFPNITSLIIGGEVGSGLISELIPTFKKFRNLRSLALTDLICIDDEDLMEYMFTVREECECKECFVNGNMDLFWEEGQEGACSCLECSSTRGHYSEALNMARFWHPLAEDQDENITRFHASRYTPVRDDAGMFVRSQCVVFADWPEISEELRGE